MKLQLPYLQRLFIVIVVMMLFPVTLLAEKQYFKLFMGKVYVSVLDSIEPLQNASVALLNVDSTLVADCKTVTDNMGFFVIQYAEPVNKNYLLRVSYTGMKTYYRNLPDSLLNRVDLGKIVLGYGAELKELLVEEPMKIIDVNGDTTIINAAAFKLRVGATLDELVRRVPGLVYDKETKAIRYNGRSINEIYVNGKPFFAGRNDIAMQNLPAEVVDKMKIYDKRSEEEEFTGVRKSSAENYVLDLKTKGKFDGTVMASVLAGAGNYDKKQLDGNAHYFDNKGKNMSLVIQSGNKDITSPGKDNRSDKGALNLRGPIGKNFDIGGSLSYNYMRYGGDKTYSYDEQYFTTGNRYQHSESGGRNRNRNVFGTINTTWSHDKTLVRLTGSIRNSDSYNSNDSRQAVFTSPTGLPLRYPFDSDIYSRLPDDIRLNETLNNSYGESDRTGYDLSVNVTQRLNRRGTSLNFDLKYANADNESERFSVQSTTYYQLQNYLGGDSILYRNQFERSPENNRSISAGVGFSQTLGKHFSMSLSYNYEFSKQKNHRNTYDLSPFSTGDDRSLFFTLPDGYENQYVDSLSNRSVIKNNGNSIDFSLNYRSNMNFITLRFSAKPSHETLYQKIGLHEADTTRNCINYTTGMNMQYRFGKNDISLSYNGQASQPHLSSLLTLTDNIDPMNITRGNPDLKPSYIQSITVMVRNSALGLNGHFSYHNTFNSVERAVTYNPVTGGRVTYPVNVNGNCNATANLGYYKNFKSRFDLTVNTGYSFYKYVGLINEGMKERPDKSITRNNMANASVKVSYNPAWGGFSLNTRWNFSHNDNSLRETSNYNRIYDVDFSAFTDLPCDIQLRSDVSYTYRSGTYMASGLDNQVLWNAAIMWRFLKQRQAEITLEWNDILNDRKNYSRSVSSMALNERYSSQIKSYFMFTFKYRFTHINRKHDKRIINNMRDRL